MDIDLQSSHPHALIPRTLTNTRIATATSIRLMKVPSSAVIVGARLGGLMKFDLTPGGGATAGMLAREAAEVMTTGIAREIDRLGKSGNAPSRLMGGMEGGRLSRTLCERLLEMK